uniref:NmrA family NAD(P)-binding protein n=1 Tax=Methylobacterium sp. B34 TaxID=95563 RepID=UPI000FE144A1
MIVVTGATGQLGKAIIENMTTRLPTNKVVASVRDAGRATDLAARGLEVRVGNFADTASLEKAFAGADRVLIVSTEQLGAEALKLHRNAIRATRDA